MLKRISKIVLIAILVELCLGGGGRITALGNVSLRMVLFCIAMILALITLIKRNNIPLRYWRIFGFFFLTILIGVVFGLLNHSPLKLIWEDVKPLLYFLILPFFVLTIDKSEGQEIARIIKISSVTLAVSFFLLVFLINVGIIPFLNFYRLTEKTVEFFYRGELTFFYKGFLFFGIGSIFYYFSDSNKKYFFISILVLAIIVSVTRGFLFSLAVTFAIHLFKRRLIYYSVTAAMIAISIVLWGNQVTINFSRWVDSNNRRESFEKASPHLLGGRNYSDAGRFEQITEVKDRISFSSVLVGHGFGQGVPSRPVHMEISYLEIFHKQGFIGLAFWGLLAGMVLTGYRQALPSLLANAFFFSALFIFIESLTNQYINNPIGMSMLLLFLVCLDKLKMKQ